MISENIKRICDNIETAKKRLNLDYAINLMAVSKTFPKESVIEAINCGQLLFGENRILEAHDKFSSILNEGKKFDLHIIGHIQRNKVRECVAISSTVESIDKIETLDVIEREASKINKKINFLIEVNTSFEEQKYGIKPEEIEMFIEKIIHSSYKFCNLTGVMTVGPLTDDKTKIRESFRLLKRIFDKTKENLKKSDFDLISMGMSGDYDIAIEEGSNQIRVGSAIFGKR